MWGIMNIMTLSRDTQQIINQVEELTGKPVQLLPDPALATFASIKIAGYNMPAHFLSYRPDVPGLDYSIAFQCEFALRIFQNPPDARFEFLGKEEGRQSVHKALAGPNGILKEYNLPVAAVKTVTDQLFDGLMTQLRSLPIGMRVDASLRDNYPALSTQQEQSFAAQQAQAAQGLSPQVRKMSPPTVFSANAAMNAAYALFCDRILGRPLYSVVYRSTGLVDRGQALLDLWDQTPQEPTSDRALVDTWGNELGLSDWYAWTPGQQ